MKLIRKILLVVGIIILSCVFITSCSFSTNDDKDSDITGTYYLYEEEQLDKDSYFIITSSSWTDENNDSGTYELNGTTIIFYMPELGNEELYRGTIGDGKLEISLEGIKTTYYKEDSEPTNNNPNPDDSENEKKYTISFEVNGHGEKPSDITNVTIIPNELPILEANDYIFDGWYFDDSLTNKVVLGAKITGNNAPSTIITLYAKWVEVTDTNSVTLSFETNGGTEITSQKVLIGNAAIKPDNPTKEGFIFDGWYSDSAFTKAYNFSTLISINKTIYAKWVKDCVVTFVNYDGTSLKSYHVKYGESVVYDGVAPTHKDNEYVFVGWDKSLISIKESMTINATFEKVLEGTNGFEYSLSYDKTYYIIEGIGDINEEEVIVPYTFNNLPIKEISSGALSDLTNTKKIIIQSNIEKIGSKAITGCTNLEEIVLPFVGESKTTNTNILFNYIFDSIPSTLTTIRINGGEIKGTMNNMGGFNKLTNSNVRNIYFSSAVTKGGYYGFGVTSSEIKLYIEDEDRSKYEDKLGPVTYFNAGNDTMTIKDGVTYLIEGNNATIVDCNRNLSSVNISSNITINGKSYSITKVGEKAFKSCLKLRNIQLPSSIKSFEKEAFAYCNSLSVINLPSSLIEIGANSFEHCVLLTSLTLPTNLIKIGSNAFKNCEGITFISLNSNLEYIDYNAFYNCKNLTNLSIPTSVYYIGSDAFYGCSKLIYNQVSSGNGEGYYLGNSSNKYLWLISGNAYNTRYTMLNTTKHIYPNAFSQSQTINPIIYTLSSSLETIGYNAFGNTKFESIIIPSSVYWIDDYVFSGKNIVSINLPSNLKHLGAGAFYNCSQLKEVNIPDSITEIRSNTFNGCTNLEDIIFNNVTTIGANAFYNCKKLMNIFLDDNVKIVGNYCFDGDNRLNIYIKGTEIPVGFSDNFNPSNANIIFVDKIPVRGLTVTLKVNDTNAGVTNDLSSMKFNEGNTVTISAATNEGYTFVGWYNGNALLTEELSYTFTMPAENQVYTAKWTANTNTTYKVEHYLQNIDNTSYPTTPYEVDELYGTTNASTEATAKTYDGFTTQSVTQQTINPNGTTVVKIYYTRQSKTLTLNMNNTSAGTVTGAGTYKYGKSINIKATANPGYTFIGWYNGNTKLSTNSTYTFSMPAKNVSYEARYTINKYTITINNQAAGITISGIASGNSYEYDSQITLTSRNIPSGYTIKWERSDGSTYVGDNYKFKVPSTNITITTIIVTPPYTRDGNKIYFGTYPQTKITDNTLISELNTLAGTKPTSTNKYKWTDYDYYISSKVTSYMFYQDIDYDNNGTYDYRGVYFTKYRPYDYSLSSTTSNSIQDDNGYATNTIYWFSYDPIEWDVLSESNGEALIIANLILDAQFFYPSNASSSYYNPTDEYGSSRIKSWLNSFFYGTVFTDLQKEVIKITRITSPRTSSDNKVFILSETQATTYYDSDSKRLAKGTDYAKIQGLYVNNSNKTYSGWWLSTIYSSYGFTNYVGREYIVDSSGGFSYSEVYEIAGVRPACWITL